MTVLIKDKKVKIPVPKLLTYEDYARLTPAESADFELHNGKIIVMPTPIPLHQEISLELSLIIGSHVKKNQLGKLFTAPMDVRFTDFDTLQPDLFFIDKNNLTIIGQKKIEGTPDLVIEILSEGTYPKEMNYKKFVYETSGVREYWIINMKKQFIRKYQNIDNEFFMEKDFLIDEIFRSNVITDLSFEVAAIFPVL